jgi:flagellar biosynthesis/type III secretory pathway chaperone
MADQVSRLISLLAEQEGVLQELLVALEEEQRSLVRQDLEQLQGQVENKQGLYERMALCSRRTRQLVEQLATETGGVGARNLSGLLPKLPQPQREALQETQRRMLELSARVEKLTAFNGQLLQNALTTVNRSLEFFSRIFNRGATYGGSGRIVNGSTTSRLVRG